MDQDFVDELFGDSGALSIPPTQPSCNLGQRIDELHACGCTQKIAWSKNGVACYVNPDGRSINLINLCVRPATGRWRYYSHRDHFSNSILFRLYQGRQLAHVSWNHNGTDLLVADIYGRITIIGSSNAVNRLLETKLRPTDGEDSYNALVGMVWLNSDRSLPVPRTSSKIGNKWTYNTMQYKPRGPYNPDRVFRSFIGVTRGGFLRLTYQFMDRWNNTRIELNSCSKTSDILTHAAFSFDYDHTILVLVHTVKRELRLYRVNVNWNQSSPEQKQKPLMPATLTAKHLASIQDCGPKPAVVDISPDFLMTAPTDALLSHLELIPPNPFTPQSNRKLPTILAIFTSALPSSDHPDNEPTNGSYTVFRRWEVTSQELTLPSGFDSISKRSNADKSSGFQKPLSAGKLEDIRIDGCVLIHLQQLQLGTILLIAYNNGRVLSYDASTLNEVHRDNLGEVSGFTQQGFRFPESVKEDLAIGLSPNQCAKISLKSDFSMEHSVLKIDPAEIREESTIIFAMHLALASMSTAHGINRSYDDLLMAFQALELTYGFDHDRFQQQLLAELFQALRFSLDQVANDAYTKIIHNTTLQRLLSIQAAVGFQANKSGSHEAPPSNDFEPSLSDRPQGARNLPSKLAWIILNLRHLSVIFFYLYATSRGPNNQEVVMTVNPEMLRTVLGLAQWFITLIEYILDQLYEMQRHQYPKASFSIRAIQEHSLQTQSSPGLLLLLLTLSRNLLNYSCRAVRGLSNCLVTINQQHVAQGPSQNSLPINSAIASLAHILDSAKVKPQLFEALLHDVESSFKSFRESRPELNTQVKRETIEKGILMQAKIPEEYGVIIEKIILNRNWEKDCEKSDIVLPNESDLFFSDFSLLELATKETNRADSNFIDAFSKVVIDNNNPMVERSPEDAQDVVHGQRTWPQEGSELVGLLRSKGTAFVEASGWSEDESKNLSYSTNISTYEQHLRVPRRSITEIFSFIGDTQQTIDIMKISFDLEEHTYCEYCYGHLQASRYKGYDAIEL